MATINEIARDTDGSLPSYAWPGGYPLVYHSTDGQAFCPSCANQTDADPEITGALIHWEGQPVTCDGCGKDIESAYGDPDAEEAT